MPYCSTVVRASFVFFLLFPLACHAGTSETLEYQVVYRGVFSAGTDLPIADLSLDAPLHEGSSGIRQVRLTASSMAYPLVESVFPIRYRFRSWIGPGQGQLQGFETYERTRKLRHRLYLPEKSGAGMRRYDLAAGAGRQELSQLEAGVSPTSPPVQGGQLFDRLGLLQRIRSHDLHEQAMYQFAVSNGRERLDYRVKVESAQTVTIGGLVVPAWKLRFDGSERERNGREVAAHRPVYVWLSRTPARIPLRVDSRQPIGLFRVELKNRTALNRLAQAGP